MPFLRAAASPQLQTIIAKQVCDSPVARSSYFFFPPRKARNVGFFFLKGPFLNIGNQFRKFQSLLVNKHASVGRIQLSCLL